MLEASKGLLVLLVALGVVELVHGNLEEAAAHLLMGIHVNPQRRLGRVMLEAASRLDNFGVAQLAALAAAYSTVRFVEAWGLWRGRAWAQWFAIFFGLVYLPWEIRALQEKPGWMPATLIAGNLALVLFLALVRWKSGRH